MEIKYHYKNPEHLKPYKMTIFTYQLFTDTNYGKSSIKLYIGSLHTMGIHFIFFLSNTFSINFFPPTSLEIERTA